MKMGASEIHILDCSKISGGKFTLDLQKSLDFQEFAQNLGKTLSEIGLIYLENHGLDSVINAALTSSKEFFELDLSTKLPYIKSDAEQRLTVDHGYLPVRNNSFRQSFTFNSSHICKNTRFPTEISTLNKSIKDFQAGFHNLSKKMMLALAIYLGLDDVEFFLKQHKVLDNLSDEKGGGVSWSEVRSRYYMPMKDEDLKERVDGEIRLPAHTDFDTFTMLIQNAGGLEAQKPSGDWIPVTPMPGTITMNAGSVLEMWSGGIFPSTPHRVRFVKEEANSIRQSLGWFLLPDGDTTFVPLVQKKQGWDWINTYPSLGKQGLTDFFLNGLVKYYENDKSAIQLRKSN